MLWTGWLLPQFLLLGPALIGLTVYIPVDLLNIPGVYLPRTPEYQHVVPNDGELMDLVLVSPAFRDFSAQEFRAGRLPLWRPANFAGAPFATWPKYSPFEFLYCLAPSPVTPAWIHLAQMLCLGTGTWLFLRRGLNLSYWPAAIVSWCAPLTGFISLWQGYPVVAPVCWLPWSLLAVQYAVRRPWNWGGLSVAIVSAILLFCGQSDVGGLVLLTSGLFALWLLAWDQLRAGQWRSAASAAVGLVFAWSLAFVLATPFLLPMLEYARTGARIQARAQGFEERPPVGLQALPAVVLPDVHGHNRPGSMRIVTGNRLESTSAAYAGLIAMLWLAPLAWCHGEYRREVVFMTLLAIAGLSWSLNFPGAVQLLRLPPFNLLSYNRWVFATSFAVLVLSAIGLEQLRAGPTAFRRWFLAPMIVVAAMGVFFLLRAFFLPEPIRTQLEALIRIGRVANMTVEGAGAVRRSFVLCYAIGAGLSLVTLAAWAATFAPAGWAVWCRRAVIALLPVELFWFAMHEHRQADRALYYPRVPALEQLARLPSGRVWGVRCFPPNLNASHGLEEIRGYDAVDPSQFVKLFELARDPKSLSAPFAATGLAVPKMSAAEGRLQLHPVADLLNVRYLVFRSPPGDEFAVRVHQDDYWIVENSNALPRAFVPRTVRVVAGDDEALDLMRREAFDPRRVAFTGSDPGVADSAAGKVSLDYESPGQLRLEAQMEADGLVVITDLWDTGWQAELDGASCSIHRVDVALRGVRVPAGKHVITMTYAPASVRTGLQIAGAASACLIVWSAGLWFAGRRNA